MNHLFYVRYYMKQNCNRTVFLQFLVKKLKEFSKHRMRQALSDEESKQTKAAKVIYTCNDIII